MSGAPGARWSLSELTFYVRIMPAVISWPTLALACLYVLALPFVPALRLARADAVFLCSWVLVGYAFYSMIAVKEARHILFITYPFTLAAILVLDQALAQFRIRSVICLTFAGGVLAETLVISTVPFVAGMREAADAVAQLAPPETNVGFWGSRDGTFIYAMRAYSGRRDLGVIRLDKVLLSDVAVYIEHGFKENVMKPDEIADTLGKLHVQYVVFQTRFHDDLASVKMLEEALGSDKFSEVGRIPMSANYGKGYIADLVIYRLKAEVPRGRVAPPMQIRLLGRTL